ncbi:hypothetical protein PSECIP111854_02337 [Pseudoalteromonas sp. CIP111854]|uniref:Protein TonB n=1 Tax=Pseudoalteromonas holothuriae TaxID=2963714 RepID=A0A9W4QYT2_9GAMM|nr:energy transducer TonB [Pseudoalteromonas sp. CIP111854]CAH9059120.1 hypothetical protein PSECIP111854_02337 [Pseudoalteromonas sp. CIP111854]
MQNIALQPSPFNYKKLTSALLGGTLMTGAAFILMQQLITQDNTRPLEIKSYPVVEIAQNREDSPTEEKTRLPPPPKMQPPPTRLTNEATPNPSLTMSTAYRPSITTPKVGILAPTLMPTEGSAVPIVRAEPKYPAIAARDGIQGWVKLTFAISPTGEVTNINVLDARPKRTFNRAAIAALKRWKYRPKIENGRAVLQTNQNVVLEFKLAQ